MGVVFLGVGLHLVDDRVACGFASVAHLLCVLVNGEGVDHAQRIEPMLCFPCFAVGMLNFEDARAVAIIGVVGEVVREGACDVEREGGCCFGDGLEAK